MLKKLAFALAAVLCLSIYPASKASAALITVDISNCKIPSQYVNTTQSLGWPRNPLALPSHGSVRMLVLAVDFRDAVEKGSALQFINSHAELGKVSYFLNAMSDSAMKLEFNVDPNYVRLPSPSSTYGNSITAKSQVDGELGDHFMTHDALAAIASKYKISDYAGVLVVVSGGASLSGNVGIAASSQYGIITTPSGSIDNSMTLRIGSLLSPETQTWKFVVHNILNLMGLENLYLSSMDNGLNNFLGRSSGPFGQMSSLQGNGSDMLLWAKWLLGWLPDSRVMCIDPAQNPAVEFNLGAIQKISSNNSGIQLFLIKISPTKVIAAEAIPKVKISTSNSRGGILIYTVDTSVAPGDGPVNIISKPTPVTTAPPSLNLPDYVRLADAPLQPGEFATYQNFLFINVGNANDPNELHIYQDADALLKYEQLLQERMPQIAMSALANLLNDSSSTVLKARTLNSKMLTTVSNIAKVLYLKGVREALSKYQLVALSEVDIARMLVADLAVSTAEIYANSGPITKSVLEPAQVNMAEKVISKVMLTSGSLSETTKKMETVLDSLTLEAAAGVPSKKPSICAHRSCKNPTIRPTTPTTPTIRPTTPAIPVGYRKAHR